MALEHSFFTDHDLSPSVKDMVLLPSKVLQLLNVLDDPKYEDEGEVRGEIKVPRSLTMVVLVMGFLLIRSPEGSSRGGGEVRKDHRHQESEWPRLH